MKRDENPATEKVDVDGVVHDVNQMLMAIIGRAEFLRRYGAAGDLAAELESIETAARDASAMLERLRPDAAGRADGRTADLKACVGMATGIIRPPHGADWAAADATAAPDVWVLADRVPAGLTADLPPVLVREILNNLLLNSLEVLPRGGRITVEGEGGNGRVRLWFSDDGPGVPVDLAPHIFAPGRTTSGESGRGVGLAACRRLLAQRDGVLDLAEPRHGGATFVLDLPAAATASGVSEAPVAGTRVLVVDDEPAVREMLADVLEAWGCRVTAVADGAAAREACAAAAVDVMLVDVGLPGEPGPALAADLRRLRPAAGVVLMTGVDRAGDLDGVDGALADATVLKPLDLDDLRRLVLTAADLARVRGQDGPEGKDTA